MPEAVRAGFPVHWREFGSGPDHAVLLHCALASSRAWTGLAGLLGDRLSMVAPDMPGHGRSGDWDRRGDMHDQVTAIARNCLGGGGHVIGHSFGGTVALRLAIEVPDLVRSVTLIEPVLFAAARDSDPDALRAYLDKARGFRTALERKDWTAAAAGFVGTWGAGQPGDELSAQRQAVFASRMPFVRETEPWLLEDSGGLLAAGRLEGIACPVLLIRGQISEPVIAAIHATLAGRIPNVAEAVVAGAGHMVPITHPEPVAALIRDHLASA